MVYGLTTLSLTKTPNKAVILPGENVWYTIRVTNTGGFYALDTTIADTLPPNVIFRFMTGTDWTCINTGNISVACSYSKMIPNGASAPDMTLYITSPQATEKDNVITNTINGALWNPAAPVTPATGVITAKGVPIPMLDMAGYILLTVLLAGTSLIILMRRH
jgi:uncharacterized repeat protein (TIGR01451 family)